MVASCEGGVLILNRFKYKAGPDSVEGECLFLGLADPVTESVVFSDGFSVQLFVRYCIIVVVVVG